MNNPIEKLAENLSKLTVKEAVELSKMLEEQWGVSAVAPAAVTAPAATGEPTKEQEEKTAFTVVLTAIGDKKINVIKEVRTITGLGLKESKDLVEATPTPLKKEVSKEEAEDIQKKLTEAGATVELQ